MSSFRSRLVAVLGATGFMGSAMLARLSGLSSVRTRVYVRRSDVSFPANVESVLITDLASDFDWRAALANVQCLIHAAAFVHNTNGKSNYSRSEFQRVNVDGTLNLAVQAANAGVKRFIFISSIKVNGESTRLGNPYTSHDIPAPSNPYAISKREAEDGLRKLSVETGMEVVIIRPPLVYGPGVKANFLSMMRWLHKGIPLPLGAIHNKRSLVALDNLIDLIVTCIDHPEASGQVFLVSDGEDLSTTELLRRLGKALGRRARLLPVPSKLLELSATILGRRETAQRLCGSLQVDISRTCQVLGWHPPMSVDEALRKTAEDFLRKNCK